MRFLVRAAFTELIRRPAATALVAGVIAIASTLVLTNASVDTALKTARRDALLPLRTARIDLTVSTVPTDSGPSVTTVELDPELLVPGSSFTHDELRIYEYESLPSSAVAELSRSANVAASAPVLVIAVDRVTGTAPRRIVIPERTVAPLTPKERALVDERASADPRFQEVQRELLGLYTELADGHGSAKQERRFRDLGRQLGEIELAAFPARFRSFPAETFKPDPVHATSDRLTLVGFDPKSDVAPLSRSHVVSGTMPSEDGQVALTEQVAARSGARVGDVYRLLRREYVVSGIVRPPLGSVTGDAYLSYDALRAATGLTEPNTLLVRTRGPEDMTRVRQWVEQRIPGASAHEQGDISVRLVGTLAKTNEQLGSVLSVVSTAVVLGFGSAILVIVIAAVFGLRHDIGVLAAVGWSRLCTSTFVALASALRACAGLLIGIAASAAVSEVIASRVTDVRVAAISPTGAEGSTVIALDPTVPWHVAAALSAAVLVGSMLTAFVSAAVVSSGPTASLLRDLER